MTQKISHLASTQSELAQHLGVSQITISRVLNGKSGVGEELRERVLEKIKSYGYVRDDIAAGLRIKSTRTIGLVVPDVSDSFFPAITASIEAKAWEKDYRVILAHSHESYSKECIQINLLRGLRIGGLIIAPAGNQDQVDIYYKLRSLKIPFVFIDRFKEKVRSSYVTTDTATGTLQIGRYLIEKGYKQWGYLSGPKGISSSEEHYSGLLKSTEENRTNIKIVSVVAGFREEDGYHAAEELLSMTMPDVIIAVNDLVAIGAYRFLKEKKIRVPKDIALVGFSNLKNTDLFEVPLTTVNEPVSEIGRKAVDILLEQMENPGQEIIKIKRLMPELIIRTST